MLSTLHATASICQRGRWVSCFSCKVQHTHQGVSGPGRAGAKSSGRRDNPSGVGTSVPEHPVCTVAHADFFILGSASAFLVEIWHYHCVSVLVGITRDANVGVCIICWRWHQIWCFEGRLSLRAVDCCINIPCGHPIERSRTYRVLKNDVGSEPMT